MLRSLSTTSPSIYGGALNQSDRFDIGQFHRCWSNPEQAYSRISTLTHLELSRIFLSSHMEGPFFSTRFYLGSQFLSIFDSICIRFYLGFYLLGVCKKLRNRKNSFKLTESVKKFQFGFSFII